MKTGFFKKVYLYVQTIPAGKVSTYGLIARALKIKDTRIVGWALHANKDGSNVPCHRVVNKDGRLALGYVFGGLSEQKMRLKAEGVKFVDETHADLIRCLYAPRAVHPF